MSGSTAVVPVVIVGGGPCGLAAAVSTKQAGIDAVVLEAGCVVNSIMGYPTYISFFSTAEKLSIGMPFSMRSGGKMCTLIPGLWTSTYRF